MDKFTDRGHVTPFLLAFFTAVFEMPTDVVAVNYGEMGHEHTQPWRSRATASVGRVGRTLMARLRALCSGFRGHPFAMPAAAMAALLLVATVLPAEATAVLAIVGVPSAAEQLKPLREAQAKVRARASELSAKLAKGETLTDAERTELTGLTVQAKDVASALALAEQANEDERNAPDPDATAAGTVPAAAQPDRRSRIEVPDMTKQRGYFGRQLQAVYNFACNRGQVEHLTASDRDVLKPMMPQGVSPQAAATGLTSDVGSDGGFLVQQDRASTVIQRAYAVGEILSRITPMPISAGSNGMVLPAIDETSRADGSRYGGIVSGWLGQGNSLSSGKPKFRPMDLKLRKVGAFVYATDEMLADAVLLEAWVNKHLPLELRFRTEDAVVNGIGSNQPLGVLNSGAVISVTRNTSSRILSEDLRAMVNRMWAPLWGSAVFLVDQSTLGEFDQLAVPVGTGGVLDPSYKPAGSVPGQKYATYKGIPIVPVEYCAALGTSGDIVLVSFDEYTLIDKGGVEQAVSMHVAFLTDEQVFRFMYRVDGQCNWNAALAPKSGGDTLSCVIKLS